jgi:hypothetical protein
MEGMGRRRLVFRGSSIAASQEATVNESHPTSVSVTATKFPPLKPGDRFYFHLKFDKAFVKHDGQISAVFRRVSGPPIRLVDKHGDDPTPSARTDIQDGRTDYDMKLGIGSLMAPGKWKLMGISSDGLSPETFSVSEDITFEILELRPLSIHVAVPETMQAEHTYTMTVTLDEYPTDVEKG